MKMLCLRDLLLCTAVLVPLLSTHSYAQTKPTSLFDPARHMRVSEVKPGMKGYGLSVFLGTKIEKFDVEVISILKNFNPKTDVILIKFGGDNLEHNLAIAGMSGSPIYLFDESGKARMVGAFAYGWPFQKDPIAGVQPIEYMLKLPGELGVPTSQPSRSRPVESFPLGGKGAIHKSIAGRPIRWSLSDSVLLPGMKTAPRGYPLASLNSLAPNPELLTAGGESRMMPLATPLMIGGISPRVLKEMDPLFRAYGFMHVCRRGVAGLQARIQQKKCRSNLGSVLGVPLVGWRCGHERGWHLHGSDRQSRAGVWAFI